jgi:hypothetical protein
VISSDSQQKVISGVFGDALNFVRKSFHQWWKNVSVKNGERLIEFLELFWINVGKTDVTVVIDVFDAKLGFQSFKESSLPELVGRVLCSSFGLSFGDGGSKKSHGIDDSFFGEGHNKNKENKLSRNY